VEEEARAAVKAPLAFLPPSQDFSPSLKSTARSRIIKNGAQKKKPTIVRPTAGALGPKKKTLGGGGLSKGATVMPSSSEELSLSSPVYDNHTYIFRGIRKPDGGYAKGLFRKDEASASKAAPSAETLGAKHKFVSTVIRGQPKGFFRDSEDEQLPKGPTITSLHASNRSTHASVERVHDRIAKAHLSGKGLKDELDEMRHSYSNQLHRIAKAAGVEHVLKSF